MTVSEFIKTYNLTVFNAADTDAKISGGYAGDFLSNAVSKADENCIWFTVMNNVNVGAVAHLTGCAAVLLCEGVAPDKDFFAAAKSKNITVLGTNKGVYQAIRAYGL